MGYLLDAIGRALTPVLTDVAGGFGVQVALYRPTATVSTGGASRRTYGAADPLWAAAPAFFKPGTDDNASGAAEAIAKPFGVRTVDRGSITFIATADGVLPSVAFGDGLKILNGPYAGFTWIAEAPSVPDVMGATTTVQVTSAPAGAIT